MSNLPIKWLQCAVCGNYDYGRQWWNRDQGYGLCKECSDRLEKREGIQNMKSYYGIKGLHYYLSEDAIANHEKSMQA